MGVDQPTVAEDDGAPAQSMLGTLSREMVRSYKDKFGRGSTKTRTNWAGPDILVVLLEDTFTPAERRLCSIGEHKQLRVCGCCSSMPRSMRSASPSSA